VQKSVYAASQIERARPDVSIEILDLRSLAPFDMDAIAASVRKTSRVLVVHEDTLSFGYGAEIAARIASDLFDCLDAPVRRVAALDTWVGYSPDLEDAILPQTGDIQAAAEELLSW
jgi:2-oxoisovalerate dehydrogenase E1 component